MRNGLVTVIGITILGWTAVASVHATTVLGTSDEQLARESDAVVLGTVVKTEVLPGKSVHTRVTIAVERALKGATAGADIVIVQPGGRVGNLVTRAEGVPDFKAGDRVVVFVNHRSQGWQVHGLSLGKFDVVPSADGRGYRVVQTRTPGLTVLQEQGAPAPRYAPESLDAFMDRIQRALAAPAKGSR